MRVLALYHPVSDQAGPIQDYARDYKRFRDRELELVSLEEREGAELAKTHDVVRYPAILILSDRGDLVQLWQGYPLPLMNDLAGYVGSSDTDST